MKKLMIAAAIVCAAVVSQAATSAAWGTGTIYYGGEGAQLQSSADDAPLATGHAYFFLLAANATAEKPADYAALDTSAKIWEAFNQTDKTLTVNEHTYTLTDSKALSAGKASMDEPSSYNSGEYGYAIMIITQEDQDGNVIAYSGNGAYVKASTAAATNTKAALFWDKSGTGATATTWTNVPEPTSGLLLLLGVAGLALKRKRA